ncbi:putative mitochondrial protein AtMg00310 [Apium graveolens]|uniref:putative mitochondrial protein AtMg00310 n=1 Tax=Apium graveolens TaxID=4045 RepID=UPI003D79D002
MKKAMNVFWWGNGEAGKGIRWLLWDRLCVPKADGGLGFKKFMSFNIAMLAKQAWRLLTIANPLVTQTIRARYFLNIDFLNAKLGSNLSYVWRSIVESQEDVRHGCRRRI